jgi:hypothetical protein
MFNLGSAIGSAPAQRRDQQAKSTAMTMVNEALASQDPDKLLQAANAIKTMDPATATKLSQAAGQLRAKSQETGIGKQLQSGLNAITSAARRGVSFEDLTKLQESVVKFGGTNEQINDAYKAGLKDSPKPITAAPGTQILDPTGTKVLYSVPFKSEKQPDKAFELIEGGKYTPQSVQDSVNPDGSLDFSKLVPVSDEKQITRGKVPATVETRISKINEESTKAAVSLSRNRALQQQLLSSPEKSTGIVSQIRTSALDLAGLRDAEEEAKTMFLRTRNTDIVNKLPPGAASDRDIEVFSAGFPSENSSTEEITRYLQAEAKILAASSDMALLADRHIDSQINKGQDATMVGFEDKKQQYGVLMQDMQNLFDERVAAGEDPVTVEKELIKNIYEVLGFTPKFYR